MKRGQEFAELTHQVLVTDRSYSAKVVAAKMGLTYETLYSRLCNRTCFSADEIRGLVRCVPDPRLVSYFLQGSSYIAAERLPASLDPQEDTIWQAARRVVYESTDVLKAIELALSDKKIDSLDAPSIQKEIEEFQTPI